jgi:TolB-like protein/TM2 domain-containing membrane protein YozV
MGLCWVGLARWLAGHGRRLPALGIAVGVSLAVAGNAAALPLAQPVTVHLPADASSIVIAQATEAGQRVAIMDFRAIGAPALFGEAIAENLRNALVQQQKFVVVERAQIQQALKELSFGSSGFVDGKQAVEIGRLVGAGVIVVGSVTKIGSTYTVNARFIDVKTGVAKDARSMKTANEDNLADVVDELAVALSSRGTPPPAASQPRNSAVTAANHGPTWPTSGQGAQPPTWVPTNQPASQPTWSPNGPGAPSQNVRTVKTGRSKGIAFLLGWLVPSLGQFYAGRPERGAVTLTAYGLSLLLVIAGAGGGSSGAGMVGLGAVLAAISSLAGAIDAAIICEETRDEPY